jgi:hypothetical protein
MPEPEKERLILPLLRDLAVQAAPYPVVLCKPDLALPPEVRKDLQAAAAFLTKNLGINPLDPASLIKVQMFFHKEGVMKGGYEDEESATAPIPELRRPDVDRFRLLPVLLDKWVETGQLNFDCDDGVLSVNAVGFYNSIPCYTGVISQFQNRSLHHVFPIAMLTPNELWGMETINVMPPFPLSRIKRVFQPLTRFVLVHPDGHYTEEI